MRLFEKASKQQMTNHYCTGMGTVYKTFDLKTFNFKSVSSNGTHIIPAAKKTEAHAFKTLGGCFVTDDNVNKRQISTLGHPFG